MVRLDQKISAFHRSGIASAVTEALRHKMPNQRLWLVLLAIAATHAVAILILGLNQPPLDLHPFRQTQTALTAFWLAEGGPWLRYETPVLGAPWSIPFEFPIYQLIVAALSKLYIPLNASGRLVSFAFFIATLWPLRLLFSALKLPRAALYATALLYLFSPFYLYWGRTFMIETCAVFFGLMWLALVAQYTVTAKPVTIAWAVLAGCCAILSKATTFPAFVLLGSALLGIELLRAYKQEQRSVVVRLLLFALAVIALPMAAGVGWVVYTDLVKSENSLGTMLTSAKLRNWNFGTIDQLLSSELWLKAVLYRALPDALGVLWYAALFSVLGAAMSRKSIALIALCLAAFLAPLLVFTNLHIVHSYYQVANAIFLISAVGIALGYLFAAQRTVLAGAILGALCAGQLWTFHAVYRPEVSRDYVGTTPYQIAQLAMAHVPKNQSLVVFGDDWSSAIPYLSQRKSLAVPAWISEPILGQVLANPQSVLGASQLGGIIMCKAGLEAYGPLRIKISAFGAGRAVMARAGDCELLSPKR